MLTRYLLRRIALALLVIVSVSAVTFLVARVVPSDPAALYAGQRPTEAQIAAARDRLGLDRPLYVQYVRFVRDVLSGDLGTSYKTKHAILSDVKAFLPATLEMVIASTILALVVGIPAGVIAGAARGSWFDNASRLISIAGVSLPTFWLALILQLIFFGQLGLLPLSGRVSNQIALFSPIPTLTCFYLIDALVTGNWSAWRDAGLHLVLPAFTLATYPIGLALRMTRAAMIEVLSEKYIIAARAQGLPERTILFEYALKNAIVPTLTVLGLSFAYSLTGAFLVEVIFSWPGLGKYVTDAILNVDFPVIVSVTLVVTLFYVVINLAVDLLQAALDPRVVLK
ncbi:MAG: ABC transporter permease [Chloroflexi bacterium]|nr:ABC transporter permease [Chloroflexota bacterium]